MEYLHSTIDREFTRLMDETKDMKKLFYKEGSFTWEELNDIAEKMAADLLKLNIKPGSRIAIWCKNSPLYLCSLLSILKIGGVAVLINPFYTTWEMNQLVEYADLRGMYCDETCFIKVQNINHMKFLNYIGMDALERLQAMDAPDEETKARLKEVESHIDPQDFAAMLFTSGSTGGPKGVELTHFQLLNVAIRAVNAMHWSSKDTVCMSLPLFHSFGLSTGFLAAIFHGGNVVMNADYHSSSIIESIEKHKCTVLNGVPTMFLSLLNNKERKNHDLSSLDSGIIAGSGVHEKDFLRISKEIPMLHLMQSYGQTEASPSITFSRYEDSVEKRAKSVGVAIPNVEIRINCTEGPLLKKEEETNAIGEVEIRGFNTMKGYFNKNAQSGEVLRKDGWMKTGDIGCIDEDGYLKIFGRSKEMIIRGGENISPQEIEEVILNLPGVSQVKVFGKKAEVIQEDIVACVMTSHPYEIDQIRNHVRKYLADYKVPKYVCFFEEFPQTANHKVDGIRLEKQACKMLEQ